MKREILVFGIILLFVGLAISPTIYADNGEVSLETTPEYDYDGYTPIQLAFLLLNKLRNNKDIQNVESEKDVIQLIESDVELDAIFEELASYSCDCEDDYKPDLGDRRWYFVCLLFMPLWLLYLFASLVYHSGDFLWAILYPINEIFNCGF